MAYEEEFIVASALDWFATNYTGTSSSAVNLHEERFDFESAVEAVEFDLLVQTDKRARNTGKKMNVVVAFVHCYSKAGSNAYRAYELADTIELLLRHVSFDILDFDSVGNPKVGMVRLKEPKLTDLTEDFNKVHKITGSHVSIMVPGWAQES